MFVAVACAGLRMTFVFVRHQPCYDGGRMPWPRAPLRILGGTAALVLVAGLLGCGKGTHAKPDGGDGSLATPDAQAGWPRSFDVVAVLSGDGSTALPPTSRFTLVLDPGSGLAIAGANGRGAVITVTTDDTRRFRSSVQFYAQDENPNVCSGAEGVRYDGFDVTVTDAGLTGSATGAASISCGDCSFLVPFSATLSGVPDRTPPTLRAAGSALATPFDAFGVRASEPLPVTASARLVADDGATITLIPTVMTGDVPLIVGFSKPDVVLRSGQGYAVTFDGLVDFAGLSDPGGPPLRVGAFPAAPIIPEDGFESVTGNTLGGAMVVTTGEALPTIAGSASLYVGQPGAPGLDASNGRSLLVKLARQPGDTRLRFSYRGVSVGTQPGFSGAIRVGSEGATPGPFESFPGVTGAPEMLTLTVAGSPVYASAVATKDLELPVDATDEVLVSIVPNDFTCGPTRISSGLLIDDLRLE